MTVRLTFTISAFDKTGYLLESIQGEECPAALSLRIPHPEANREGGGAKNERVGLTGQASSLRGINIQVEVSVNS